MIAGGKEGRATDLARRTVPRTISHTTPAVRRSRNLSV